MFRATQAFLLPKLQRALSTSPTCSCALHCAGRPTSLGPGSSQGCLRTSNNLATVVPELPISATCPQHRSNLLLCLALCRETRYFKTWKRAGQLEDFLLPTAVADATGQRTCPIGDAALCFSDAVLGSETCEELFTPSSPHIRMALAGVEIITNGSGSHHQVGTCMAPLPC